MLNKDFYDSSIDASQVNAITTLRDQRLISREDAQYMIRTGRVEIQEGRTNEEINADIASDILDEDLPTQETDVIL